MRVLAIDIGTSRTKAALYDESLARTCTRVRPTRGIAHDGVVDVETLAADACAVAAETVAAGQTTGGTGATRPGRGATHPVPGPHIEAVVVTAILGYAFLDRAGTVTSARAWNDSRCSAEVDLLRAAFAAADIDPGRPLGPELLAPHLLWLRANHPEEWQNISRVVDLKDLLVARLSGEYGTDFSHRDYALLVNRDDAPWAPVAGLFGDWDLGLLMPEARPAHTVVGMVCPDAARRLGVAKGTPVVLGSSDGTAAMYGAGVLAGTGLSIVAGSTDVVMARASRAPGTVGASLEADGAAAGARRAGLSVNAAMTEGELLVGGSTGPSGSALAWWSDLVRRGDAGGGPAMPTEPGAVLTGWQDVPPGARGVVVSPGLGGERAPFYRGTSAAITGLRLDHGTPEIARAIVEANAFRLALLVERVCGAVPDIEPDVTLGGGGSSTELNAIRAALLPGTLYVVSDSELSLTGSAMYALAALRGGKSRGGRDRRLLELGQLVRNAAVPVAVPGELREQYGKLYRSWRADIDRLLDLAGGSESEKTQ